MSTTTSHLVLLFIITLFSNHWGNTSSFVSERKRSLEPRWLRRPPSTTTTTTTTTSLNGINEWRDLMFDLPSSSSTSTSTTLPKEICILPFPFDEVLLQGETKELRLYEDRFIKLFDDCMENYEGVVGMGLLASSGVIQTIPICEIESYTKALDDTFGIFLTIRVVGRASLIDIKQQEPYLKGICYEIIDEYPPNLELPNLLASSIEHYMLLLSSMEKQLEQHNSNDDMEQRMNVAKLNDLVYDDDDNSSTTIEDDDSEEDEDDDVDDDDDDDDKFDDDDDDDSNLDRRGRYSKAYKIALSTDTQGYCVQPKNQQGAGEHTLQELTAISWSAFCTESPNEESSLPLVSDGDDNDSETSSSSESSSSSSSIETYRIQALDADNLFDRLKLAMWMLREKKDLLTKQLETAGIKSNNNKKNKEE